VTGPPGSLDGVCVVVTGISGFLGRHIAPALAAGGAEVVGIARHGPQDGADPVAGEARRLRGSILDAEFLDRVLADVDATVVVHAAGAVGQADEAQELFDLNVLGTDRLLRAVRRRGIPAMVIASSSAVYGAVKELPIDEDAPLRPVSPYGASKVAQEMVARQYELAGGPAVVRARFFNIVGPGQKPSLVLSHLASRVAAAERGGDPLIPLGNAWPRRDFVDVRDAARAVVLLTGGAVGGQALNVASGRSWSIAECAGLLAAQARCAVRFEVDPERQRDVDVGDQVGSWARLHALTGWRPQIPFEQTVSDVLTDWRRRLGAPPGAGAGA
jgi:GDP-4-dehydro-6-deoxy-D-mannose reductase